MRRLGLLCAGLLLAAPGVAAAATYTAADGDRVRIEGFPAAAPAFAEFLSRLPHGPELEELRVVLARPADVPRLCGRAGLTACYRTRTSTIVAPGPELDGPLLAHEYGHHVAANRSGGAFDPVRVGPAHWASQERVCSRLRSGRIGNDYTSDPAEVWADVYTRLTYPDLPWRFAPLLRPSPAALAAAARDVAGVRVPVRASTFRGSVGPGRRARRFSLPVRYDGTIEATVSSDAAVRVRISVGAARSGWGERGYKRVRACRAGNERVVVTVQGRSGSGPFTLRARYPG